MPTTPTSPCLPSSCAKVREAPPVSFLLYTAHPPWLSNASGIYFEGPGAAVYFTKCLGTCRSTYCSWLTAGLPPRSPLRPGLRRSRLQVGSLHLAHRHRHRIRHVSQLLQNRPRPSSFRARMFPPRFCYVVARHQLPLLAGYLFLRWPLVFQFPDSILELHRFTFLFLILSAPSAAHCCRPSFLPLSLRDRRCQQHLLFERWPLILALRLARINLVRDSQRPCCPNSFWPQPNHPLLLLTDSLLYSFPPTIPSSCSFTQELAAKRHAPC